MSLESPTQKDRETLTQGLYVGIQVGITPEKGTLAGPTLCPALEGGEGGNEGRSCPPAGTWE